MEQNHTQPEDIQKLGELIKDIKFAMVTTQNSEGHLQSCPLTTQRRDFDGDLWFIIGRSSALATNVLINPEVNASFSEEGNYISVTGRGSLVEDNALLAQLWSDAYKVWFPEGLQDPNIALLKIHIHEAEYWDSPSSAVVKLIASAKAYIKGDHKALGGHHKVHLN